MFASFCNEAFYKWVVVVWRNPLFDDVTSQIKYHKNASISAYEQCARPHTQ